MYHFKYKNEITLNDFKSAAMDFCSKGLKNKFETVVVNKPSVYEPLKFYCIYLHRNAVALILCMRDHKSSPVVN